MVCFHRGYLWLDQPYPVNAELIARITGLPNDGKDPLPYLAKHNLQRVRRGYFLGPIQDKSVRVGVKLFSCKIFHKMILTQCSVAVVEIVDLCAHGENFNWSRYLLNALFEYLMLGQHKKCHQFYYSWLLILISFIVWADPPDYVHMDVPISCMGERYQNLWEDRVDNNHQ